MSCQNSPGKKSYYESDEEWAPNPYQAEADQHMAPYFVETAKEEQIPPWSGIGFLPMFHFNAQAYHTQCGLYGIPETREYSSAAAATLIDDPRMIHWSWGPGAPSLHCFGHSERPMQIPVSGCREDCVPSSTGGASSSADGDESCTTPGTMSPTRPGGKAKSDFIESATEDANEGDNDIELGAISEGTDQDKNSQDSTGLEADSSESFESKEEYTKPWQFLIEFQVHEVIKEEPKPVASNDNGSLNQGGSNVRESPNKTSTSDWYGWTMTHTHVPRNSDFNKLKSEGNVENDAVTTMMIRNIPNEYTRSVFMEELNKLGFHGEYDFIYLPIDKCTQWNVGYAFVNFLNSAVAARCKRTLTNHRFHSEDPRPDKVTQVCPAYIQGLQRNVDYYRQKAVSTSIHESHRPMVLTADGATTIS